MADKLRGGLSDNDDEVVLISTIDTDNAGPKTRRSPKPPSKPGRMPPPLSRDVNTITADEPNDGPDRESDVNATLNTASPNNAPTSNDTVVDLPVIRPPRQSRQFDPNQSAKDALNAKVRKLVWTVILVMAGIVTLASLVQILPVLTIVVCWGLVLFLGGPIKEVVAAGIMTVLTLRLWVEIASVGFLIFATMTTSGLVWQWCVTAAIVTCLLHRLVFSIQTAQARRQLEASDHK